MSRTSANNEQEMRQLFVSNKHHNLQEVAQELHGNRAWAEFGEDSSGVCYALV